MFSSEECALDVLLFGTKDEELLDIKCYRGERSASPEDIKAAIHSGIMQHRMQPDIASPEAPAHGVKPRDMADFVKVLPTSA